MAEGAGAGEPGGATRLRVGTFVHARSPWAEGQGEPVFGAQVAALAFERALSRHARADIEAVFLDPAPERPPAAAGPGQRVRYHGLDEFLGDLPSRRVDAWFDVTGDVVRPFYLRAQLAQHEYPATSSSWPRAPRWRLSFPPAPARPGCAWPPRPAPRRRRPASDCARCAMTRSAPRLAGFARPPRTPSPGPLRWAWAAMAGTADRQ